MSQNYFMEEIKILLVENVHPVAKEKLVSEGYEVDMLTHSPTETEMIELLKKYQVLGIRSKTEVTEKILKESPHLATIGAFCIVAQHQ